MSAVVLTALGQAVGGPFGALTGSLVGGAADLARTRMGGRPDDGGLAGLGASYGAIIPAVYGRIRTAGTILWAQPMRRAGGGKGGGQRSYVVSLAVALSARPIVRIGRIWADGREILAADGTAEFAFPLRLASANGRQTADPLIAAIEGLHRTPGYRGISLAVLEDFPLASFGNRIPQLEFEVIADAADGAVGDWLSEATGLKTDPLSGPAPRSLVGWPAGAPQLRQDLATALRASGMVVRERDGGLGFGSGGRLHMLDAGDIVVRDAVPAMTVRRQSGIRPMAAALSYAEPERDFLEGEQQIFQSGTGEPVRLATAIAMEAAVARQVAGALLRESGTAPDVMTVRLSFRFLDIVAGDRICIDGEQQWMVAGRTLEDFEIVLDCVAWNEAEIDGQGDPGRVNRVAPGPRMGRRIGILELPIAVGAVASEGIVIAVSAGRDWPGAMLVVDDGDESRTIGFQREPARAGILGAALRAGPETVWDEANSIEVAMDSEDDWIESREYSAVLGGSNLLWCGGELIQFRDAMQLGPGRFRLAGLLRGRMGTAGNGGVHPVGTDVWFLDPSTMLAHAMGVDLVGRRVRVAALEGGGDQEADHEFAGIGHAPLAPAHVRAVRGADDSILLSWIGRERRFVDWHGADEEVRPGFFTVQFWQDGEVRWSQRVRGETLSLSLAEQVAAVGGRFDDLEVRVVSEGVGPEAVRASALVGI